MVNNSKWKKFKKIMLYNVYNYTISLYKYEVVIET
jgi:hypothetical protein